jgi:hypothetical protein
VEARNQTKNGGGYLKDRYNTHIYCKWCETYHRRTLDPVLQRINTKRIEKCPCCGKWCRNAPSQGGRGKEKYALKKQRALLEVIEIDT